MRRHYSRYRCVCNWNASQVLGEGMGTANETIRSIDAAHGNGHVQLAAEKCFRESPQCKRFLYAKRRRLRRIEWILIWLNARCGQRMTNEREEREKKNIQKKWTARANQIGRVSGSSVCCLSCCCLNFRPIMHSELFWMKCIFFFVVVVVRTRRTDAQFRTMFNDGKKEPVWLLPVWIEYSAMHFCDGIKWIIRECKRGRWENVTRQMRNTKFQLEFGNRKWLNTTKTANENRTKRETFEADAVKSAERANCVLRATAGWCIDVNERFRWNAYAIVAQYVRNYWREKTRARNSERNLSIRNSP